MLRRKKNTKMLSLLLAAAMCVGSFLPVTTHAAAQTEKKNVLAGLQPTTDSVTGIMNPECATDGLIEGSQLDHYNTRINAGDEDGSSDNGYSQWRQVYLQYDLGQVYQLAEIVIYRNTYMAATSLFKDVKVEVAKSEDFSDAVEVSATADIQEAADAKGQPQKITLPQPTDAQYVRVYGKGHYITNANGLWAGYSNGVLFNEIQVFANVPVEGQGQGQEQGPQEMVDSNIMIGLKPTSNSPHRQENGGPTVPQVQIKNPECATDGIKDTSYDDNTNTKIIAGQEKGGQGDNGYSTWNDVYLQYDFGKEREVKEIRLYRNSYEAAKSDFKDVKVELSSTSNFSGSTVVYGPQDYCETPQTKGQPQIIKLETPVKAQYIRIWQKGHYIQNIGTAWKGYSNGVLLHEIEVIASVPKSEIPTPPPVQEAKNIALNKMPYVRGLTPTNIEAITDGKADNNFAVHNSTGKRWLQFEYKNRYNMKEIKFKLEEGSYSSVEITVSDRYDGRGTTVFREYNWTQGPEMQVVDLGAGVSGQYVRFTVSKDYYSPTKYSEIEIWATGKNFDESKPEYKAPASKYDTLVWNDEFDGSAIDESKWNIIEGMANHGAIYNRKAVSIKKDGENSYLAINSKNYETTDALIQAVGWDQYQNQSLKSKVTWSSGRLESKNKFSFQFGRMAVRAKTNDSKGIWPAIWMLCQDETGHDEIDVLEYLGQDSWDAWTTNHFGILDKNKKSDGVATKNYEAWCQDFHVYEVEWDPARITFYIDGKYVHSTAQGKDRDGMHTRSMFPILETQVGDGWVGDVDYYKQETKQDSDYLVDWVRVYQTADQPVTRFDDLEKISGGTENDYLISAKSSTDGLIHLTDGKETFEDKDAFYYGGQPRYETSRVAVAEGAKDQYLIYAVPGAKDVHLTTYYQTVKGIRSVLQYGDVKGRSIRSARADSKNIDFKIFTSPDGSAWTEFTNVKVLDNFPEAYPSYARHTFDAYGLPEGTNYVKVQFPDYEGASYYDKNGYQTIPVKNTDIQLAKVTFLQKKGAVLPAPKLTSLRVDAAPTKTEYFEGETFDPTGLKVVAVYSDGTEKDVTAEVTYKKDPLTTADTAMVFSFGDQEVSMNAEQLITVKPVEVTELKINVAPTKTEYVEGETFDATGMQIVAVYNNGTEKDVTAEVTYAKDALKTTDNEVVFSYTEKEKTTTISQPITVKEKVVLSELIIKTVPNKQVYTQGESFDPTGMKVVARYSDGTEKDVTDQVTFSKEALKETDKAITFTYTENGVEVTVSQEIFVNAKEGIQTSPTPTPTQKPTQTPTKPGNGGNNSNSNLPNTGDETPIMMWMFTAVLAAAILGGVVRKRKMQ